MLNAHLAKLCGLLQEVCRPAVTQPSFANLLVLVVGWILTISPTHAVTEALVFAGVSGHRHHEAFHRFFSRGTWSPDAMGYYLLRRIEPMLSDGVLRIVIDDTLASKKGPHVFGIGTHLDAVRSTKLYRVFSFGHCWVVLSVLVRVPFSSRVWALPILFRLFRNEKDHDREGTPHRKKTELAREMLDAVIRWFHGRIEVCGDLAYCNDTVMHGLLSERVVFFGSMRADAVLTALPVSRAKTGRPQKRGNLLPKPEKLAADNSVPWKSLKANLYGKTQTIYYKEFVAQWYRACGEPLLHIVIVKTTTGTLPFRVFFCTDPLRDVRIILETYAFRWATEVCFRDIKQLFGFADSSARLRAAVLRVAPFVGMLYSILVVWFAQDVWTSTIAQPPVRPWYPKKRDLCFADILRAARRMLDGVNVLDLAIKFNNLQKVNSPGGTSGGLPEKVHWQSAA
jgi:hypothetical protein